MLRLLWTIKGGPSQKPEKKLHDVTDSEKEFGECLDDNSKVEDTIVYYLSFLRCPQLNTQGYVFLSCRIMDREGFIAQGGSTMRERIRRTVFYASGAASLSGEGGSLRSDRAHRNNSCI